jgi:hypothetical protein
MFACCGQGFWKTRPYFFLSNFGENQNAPWVDVIDLDGLRQGLGQQKPRTQWLFFDRCQDISATAMNNLSNIGDPLIQTDVEELLRAKKFGPLAQFWLSSRIGMQAFGMPGVPTRFFEMLIDTLDGSGAISKFMGAWWIDDRGISNAV